MKKFSHLKIKYFLYVVFSILFLYSCSKEDEDEISIISQTEIIQYNLTVSNSTNGRVRVSQGTFYYDSQVVPVIKGQLVTIEAWADEGYRFESWSNGETDEIINIISSLKRHCNKIASLTADNNSTIAKSSDIKIQIKSANEACPLNLAPTSSTTNSLAFGDALSIALLEA